MPGRSQRLGQVHADEDRRGPGRARQGAPVHPARHHDPLPRPGARLLGLRHHARLRRGRPAAGRVHLPRPLSAGEPRPHRRGGPADALGRRGAAHRAGAGACPGARRPAPRRAHQPPRPSGDRVARSGAEGHPRGARPDQPRPALPLGAVPGHDLAGPRRDPADRPGLLQLRGLARRLLRGGGARSAQARPQDRRGGALAALRRHRPAQAQRPPPRQPARAAPGPPRGPSPGGQRQHAGVRRGILRQPRGRGARHRESLRRADDRRRACRSG